MSFCAQSVSLPPGGGTPLSLLGGTLPVAIGGQSYSQNIAARVRGGVPPFTFNSLGSVGPDTPSVSPSGVISLTPPFLTTPSSYSDTATVQVTDSTSAKANAPFTIPVFIYPPVRMLSDAAPSIKRAVMAEQYTADLVLATQLVLTGETLPTATVGVAYSQNIAGQASGGTPPYTFSMATGVPYTISSAGVITGTPSYRVTNTGAIRTTNAALRII